MIHSNSNLYPLPPLKYLTLTWPAPYVAHIEINRQQKLNAFIESMWLEFPPLLSHLSYNPSCRAVILSGAGDSAFTTGIDVTAAATTNLFNPQPASTDPHELEPWETNSNSHSTQSPSKHHSNHDDRNNNTAYPRPHPPPPAPHFSKPTTDGDTEALDPARRARLLREHILTFQASISSLATCRKPLIAALHGHCLGLGIDIACCADIRLCTLATTFSVKEIDIGLAADVGTLTRLGKIVGNSSWCKEVCLSARPFTGQEAKDVGFVSRVVGDSALSPNNTTAGDVSKSILISEAISLAALIASKSPVAVQGTKDIMDYSREHSTEDGLRYTAVWNSAMLQTGDIKEAMVKGGRRERASFAKL